MLQHFRFNPVPGAPSRGHQDFAIGFSKSGRTITLLGNKMLPLKSADAAFPVSPAIPGSCCRYRQARGLTLVEIIVVTAIFGIVSGALYQFLHHFTSSYIKIDDKLESVTEGWQILRVLKDDLVASDAPDGDPERWNEVIRPLGEGGFEIIRRCDDQLGSIIYYFDRQKGNVSREEQLPGKASRKTPLMQNRCLSFEITPVTQPATVTETPEKLLFQVHLELGNVSRSKDTSKTLVIDTHVVPVFLNQKLNHRYIHQDVSP